MKDSWKAAMDEAARLTRNGRVGEASALIARALSGHSAPPSSAAGSGQSGPQPVRFEGEVARVPEASVSSDGESGAAVEWSWQSFENVAGARDYRLFVPAASSAGDSRRPLILMLHGCGQEPDDFAVATRMNALAADHGCCLLYPAQSSSVNANRCWGWYEESNQIPDRGEPAILAGMVRHLIETRAIDPCRVYVAGFSAGGAMAATLVGLYPRLFAAAGVHSGLPWGVARDLMSALIAMHQGAMSGVAGGVATRISSPLIVFHGDADTTVNPLNALRLIEQAGFAVGDSGAGQLQESGRAPGGCGYRRSLFLDGDGRCRAELWSVEGGGHGWSGGSGASIFSEPCGPDASEEMIRFFLEHPAATDE